MNNEEKENGMDYEEINHPNHYQFSHIIFVKEVLDIIEGLELDFNTGNVIKYLLRSGKKPGVDKIKDLKKAKFYLNRLIEIEEYKNMVDMTREHIDYITTPNTKER